jgi:hypothetical protein
MVGALGLAAALAGCAGPAAPDASASRLGAPLRLERFFLGASTGSGVFRPTLAGAPRAFTLRFRGSVRGGVLTLDEDIRYADGERERKV